MDLIFQTEKGREFTIEVGYWDTIAEVKEKIQKYQQIPVERQTLFTPDATNKKYIELPDHWDIEKSLLVHRSNVLLRIAEEKEQFKPPPVRNRIQVLLALPNSDSTASAEIGVDDTVQTLKLKITQMKGVGLTIDRMVLRREVGNLEMEDSKLIRHYSLMDGSELLVSEKTASAISTSPAPSPSSSSSNSNKLISTSPSFSKRKKLNISPSPGSELRISGKPASAISTSPAPSLSSSSSNSNKLISTPPSFSRPRKLNISPSPGSELRISGKPASAISTSPAPSLSSSSSNSNKLISTPPSFSRPKKLNISTSPAPSQSSSSSNSNMLLVNLLLPDGTKFTMDVLGTDKIQKVREAVEAAKKRGELNVPEQYVFIHGTSVMEEWEEQLSFAGNGVGRGDTILIVPRSMNRN